MTSHVCADANARTKASAMYDYATQLQTFYERKVVVPAVTTKLLRARRKANRDRLISRLP